MLLLVVICLARTKGRRRRRQSNWIKQGGRSIARGSPKRRQLLQRRRRRTLSALWCGAAFWPGAKWSHLADLCARPSGRTSRASVIKLLQVAAQRADSRRATKAEWHCGRSIGSVRKRTSGNKWPAGGPDNKHLSLALLLLPPQLSSAQLSSECANLIELSGRRRRSINQATQSAPHTSQLCDTIAPVAWGPSDCSAGWPAD